MYSQRMSMWSEPDTHHDYFLPSLYIWKENVLTIFNDVYFKVFYFIFSQFFRTFIFFFLISVSFALVTYLAFCFLVVTSIFSTLKLLMVNLLLRLSYSTNLTRCKKIIYVIIALLYCISNMEYVKNQSWLISLC